jgi:hypothetical protein
MTPPTTSAAVGSRGPFPLRRPCLAHCAGLLAGVAGGGEAGAAGAGLAEAVELVAGEFLFSAFSS